MSAGFDRYFQFMYSYIKILVYMGGYYEQFRGFRTLDRSTKRYTS